MRQLLVHVFVLIVLQGSSGSCPRIIRDRVPERGRAHHAHEAVRCSALPEPHGISTRIDIRCGANDVPVRAARWRSKTCRICLFDIVVTEDQILCSCFARWPLFDEILHSFSSPRAVLGCSLGRWHRQHHFPYMADALDLIHIHRHFATPSYWLHCNRGYKGCYVVQWRRSKNHDQVRTLYPERDCSVLNDVHYTQRP